jgi:hypothetical protein
MAARACAHPPDLDERSPRGADLRGQRCVALGGASVAIGAARGRFALRAALQLAPHLPYFAPWACGEGAQIHQDLSRRFVWSNLSRCYLAQEGSLRERLLEVWPYGKSPAGQRRL